ncbi:hypothetical protein QTP88_025998 [Uroleucon formosanum]
MLLRYMHIVNIKIGVKQITGFYRPVNAFYFFLILKIRLYLTEMVLFFPADQFVRFAGSG